MSYIRSSESVFSGQVASSIALPTVEQFVLAARPEEPIYCLRPAAITEAASEFVRGFHGDVLYAVKCNPEPAVLKALWEGGVRHFDCASAGEIALVHQIVPEAAIHFMHPVKSRAWRALKGRCSTFGRDTRTCARTCRPVFGRWRTESPARKARSTPMRSAMPAHAG